MVSSLVGSLLQNLEVRVTNVIIKLCTEEVHEDNEVPTLMIRLKKLSLTQLGNEQKIDKFPDLIACLLANKKFALGEVSIHLMRKRYLNKFEYSQYTDHLEFPYSYPPPTHSSTIFLMRGFTHEESVFVEFTYTEQSLRF